MDAKAYKNNQENEIVYIYGFNDAKDYILSNLDEDSDLLYSEKEIVKLFFQQDNFKQISIKDFQNFLNQLQQQKNNNFKTRAL